MNLFTGPLDWGRGLVSTARITFEGVAKDDTPLDALNLLGSPEASRPEVLATASSSIFLLLSPECQVFLMSPVHRGANQVPINLVMHLTLDTERLV